MYFACYRLSELGLNVMPTARNAKGIDILVTRSGIVIDVKLPQE